MQSLTCLIAASLLVASFQGASAKDGENWVVSWTGSVQGPYPVGNPSAQPDQRFAFPDPAAGARDQTLRLMVRPDIWGRQARLRFSNAFGTRPLMLDGVFVGLQLGGAALVPGTNRPVHFGGKRASPSRPAHGLERRGGAALRAQTRTGAAGRKLAVSLHVAGESGPMTWHAKALQTSYGTAPGAGAQGQRPRRGGIPVQHGVLVLPRCGGHDGAGGRARSWRSAIRSPTARPPP